MGTGSQRKRNSRSRYEEYRASGYQPAAGPVSPSDINGPGPRDSAGMLLADKNMPGYDYSKPYTMRPGEGISVGPGGMGDIRVVNGQGPVNGGGMDMSHYVSDMDAGRAAASKGGDYVAWMNALHKGDPKPLTQEDKLSALFEKMYGDPSADIRAAYGAQESAINAQYDKLLGRLNETHGQAERGVKQEGAQLQSALTAIGADATAQLAASNRQIDQDYAKALRAVNNDYKPLAGDLKAQGAGGAGLKAEAAAGRADLREAQSADTTLGKRYSQMLSQEINNRQATGATVTTANVQDLARILSQSRDNADTNRMQAVAKIEASMAGDLAQAKSQKAAEKFRLFLDVLKSGGTLGDAAVKGASAGTILSATRAAQSGVPDWRDPFKGVAKSTDPAEKAKANEYLVAISSGKVTPEQAYTAWLTNKDKDNFPFVGTALAEAVAYAQTYNQKKAMLGAGIHDALSAPR